MNCFIEVSLVLLIKGIAGLFYIPAIFCLVVLLIIEGKMLNSQTIFVDSFISSLSSTSFASRILHLCCLMHTCLDYYDSLWIGPFIIM